MMALKAYENVIDHIRSSGLNFQLQLSPFSAQISLKRSLIKERSGVLLPPSVTRKLSAQEPWLENFKHESIADTIEGKAIVKKETQENEQIENLKLELNKVMIENKKYEEKVREQETDIYDLEKKMKVKNEVVNRLNQQLRDLKNKNEAEIVNIKKMHKTEVKSWRKELGEERRLKVNLEKKLEEGNLMKHEIVEKKSEQKQSGMLASDKCYETSVISDKNGPKPEQFPLTRTGFNYRPSSAAQVFSSPRNCNHIQQCIVRQPFPPPLPAMTPLVNMSSMYHTRILSGDLDWGSTCSYCFRIDYERYGCESCVWIKCFGDLHGFPDLNPYHYRKYLDGDD